MENKIVIEFTEELLEEWTKEYFKKHPRSRKRPIDSPEQPSLNKWVILQRITMNKLKQDYKDFVIYVVKHYGLEDLGISHCKCNYIIYNPTSRRRDLDNYSPKMVLDGLTAEASGVLVDDSVSCIEELTIKMEYKKGVKGARIEFYDCEYDEALLYETAIKEMAKSKKREETLKQNKINKKKRGKR
ncbi:hypothetical protein [Paraclostridium bifermentans]|uniref:hypothetical protein n=1 Tax=Paraclostridium bifermentans TaxID=1490 RepID=UPI00189E2C3B|nr:hypothetical protein [Paraclostridium bifermentans]